MDSRVAIMVKPGTIAFPVILALGAITGYLTYTYFGAVTPQEGTVVSPYREELSAASGSNNNNNSTGGGKQIDESQFSEVVNIKILEGSSVQGSPDYDPDAATATSDALITWVNEDTTLHTATSGTGPDDAESGQLFDSGFLNQEQKYSVPAADVGTGEHTYHCQVHPYMVSTITVE
jgi:cytochrome c oxidase subunit 2